ncbi:MAG TPA: hypothetical protein VFF52_17410 [Isosphaeraceae bacterium]|nr:hypothetical protein [Isosphaeraceae bacterium]
MGSMSRMPWRIAIGAATMASAIGLLIVAGCTLDKTESRPQNVFNRIGGHGGGGQVIEPRRCWLRVVILNRPFRDPAINEVIWRVADEQVVAPAVRKANEANGLRIGRVTGEMPREVETILKEGEPRNPKVVPTNLFIESGEQSLISISEPVAQISLLVNKDNRVSGKDYQAASGFIRVTARHDGAHGVALRLVPEIHHGPLQRTFPALPNATGFAPQELSIRDGQQEDSIPELAADLVLENGQVAIMGCRPESQRSLGSFLFSEATAESGPSHQRLILIWASRNLPGVLADQSKNHDRPKLFKRQFGSPPPPSPTPSPASPH